MVYMWRLEDNVWVLVFIFHCLRQGLLVVSPTLSHSPGKLVCALLGDCSVSASCFKVQELQLQMCVILLQGFKLRPSAYMGHPCAHRSFSYPTVVILKTPISSTQSFSHCPGKKKLVTCPSYSSIAVVKHQDQNSLHKSLFGLCFQRVSETTIMAGTQCSKQKTQQLEQMLRAHIL